MTRLSVVLPAFDEADRLPRALTGYLAWLPEDAELVVVDDGSTDGTREITDAAAARDARVRVLHSTRNHGKGYAVRTGILAAAGELIVFTDADGSYGPAEIDRVTAALERAPIAIGVRRAELAAGRLVRRLASRGFNLAMRSLLGLPFDDTQCGLKGFRRDAAAAVFGRARLDGFAFDAEALFLARRLGIEVVEVPVIADHQEGSKVRLAVDALRMLTDMRRVRRAAARGLYDDASQLPGPDPAGRAGKDRQAG
jgi:glycosyltransferase involved in cell wall biosynthesis